LAQTRENENTYNYVHYSFYVTFNVVKIMFIAFFKFHVRYHDGV